MLEEMKQLELMNEDYEVRIEELEKILLATNFVSDTARDTVIDKLSCLKKSQTSRKSTIGGSLLYSKMIKDIAAKNANKGNDLGDFQGSFAFN
jgi:hypothetical protein